MRPWENESINGNKTPGYVEIVLLLCIRYTWLQEDEDSMKLEGPRPVLLPAPPHSAVHKPKHVSFARSHTLTSFDMGPMLSRSPPRPHNPERLIDSQPTAQVSIPSAPIIHSYPPPEPKIVVLGT